MKDTLNFIKSKFNIFQAYNNNPKYLCERLQRNLNYLSKKNKELKLQTQSEIDNIRKRSEEEIKKNTKFAQEKLVRELLNIVDNLESALYNTENITDKIIISYIDGIKLTLRSLKNILEKFGVCVIEETHIPFNPYIHQALALLDSEDVLPEHVIKIIQKGYLLHGKLIRPAIVTVAKKTEDE